MNTNKKSILTLAFFSILAVSCTPNDQIRKTVTEIIRENPSIVFEAIEKEPEKFLEVVQVAAQSAKKKMADKARAQEAKQLEDAFNNPLKPDITKASASIGPKDAPITLIEYSDFECPFCKKGMDTVEELRKKYKGKIKFVYKHLPLSFHPNAMPAAKYFEAIKLQSNAKAFEFHDLVFKNQAGLRGGEKFLKNTAKEIGVDLEKLAIDLNSEKVRSAIEKDIAEARKFGIQGTPGFIINGVPVKGAYPAEHFEQIIEKLKEKGKLTL